MDDELGYLSATDMVARYRARSLSPVEVTRAVLARIARFNPKLNAFCIVDDAGALVSARESEQRWARAFLAGAIHDNVLIDEFPAALGNGLRMQSQQSCDPQVTAMAQF